MNKLSEYKKFFQNHGKAMTIDYYEQLLHAIEYFH